MLRALGAVAARRVRALIAWRLRGAARRAAARAHLVVEAVDLRDLPRLVVAADERDAIRVAHLHRRTQTQSTAGELSGVKAAARQARHSHSSGGSPLGQQGGRCLSFHATLSVACTLRASSSRKVSTE